MPVVESQPFLLRDIMLTLGDNDYQAHVDSVQLTPSNSTVTWQGLTPSASFSAQTTSTWTADLSGVQDHETADSLSSYLFDHEGEEVAAVFAPRNGVGRSYTATLILAPGAIGGGVNTVAGFQVSLGCKGKPKSVPQVPQV